MAEPGQGAQVAAQSLFTAASAANAIPVAGQFVSAGLAIAGLFTKIFGGRRRKKKAERAEKERQRQDANKQNFAGGQSSAAGGVGIGSGQQVGSTAPVHQASTPAFNSYGGGNAPTVQPVQQVVNSYTGMNK
ncbi:MAG: hypothetical protein OEV03_08230 [Gammaproteobacteria bacterium]|nr:hypothetical protein [Gammaproteobacteria bacterium]